MCFARTLQCQWDDLFEEHPLITLVDSPVIPFGARVAGNTPESPPLLISSYSSMNPFNGSYDEQEGV